MKRVFVDTGGFVALLVGRDASHSQAKQIFGRAETEEWKLLTTNVVVIETYSVLLMRTRGNRRSAIAFLDMVLSDEYVIERAYQADEDRAVEILHRHEDKTYSFCDALSFVVIERLGITQAIAFDRDFRDYGRFTLLEA